MSADDIRLLNVALSIACAALLAYRLTAGWSGHPWRVRAREAATTLVLGVVAYGSFQTWRLQFPLADYVPLVTGSLALLLLALAIPDRRR